MYQFAGGRFPCRIVLAEVLLECLDETGALSPHALFTSLLVACVWLPAYGHARRLCCLCLVTRDAYGSPQAPACSAVVRWAQLPSSHHPLCNSSVWAQLPSPNPLCNSSVVDRFAALRILPVSYLSTCYRRRLLIFRVLDLQATGGRGRGLSASAALKR